MYTMTKEFHFSASHMLHNLPPNHKCNSLHGHNYTVILAVQADQLDEFGFALDFGYLDEFKDWLTHTFDHAHIATNIKEAELIKQFHTLIKADYEISQAQKTFVLDAPTTAENIARYIYREWIGIYRVVSVTVKETAETSATYQNLAHDKSIVHDGFKEEPIGLSWRDVNNIEAYLKTHKPVIEMSDSDPSNEIGTIGNQSDTPPTLLGIPIKLGSELDTLQRLIKESIGTNDDSDDYTLVGIDGVDGFIREGFNYNLHVTCPDCHTDGIRMRFVKESHHGLHMNRYFISQCPSCQKIVRVAHAVLP